MIKYSVHSYLFCLIAIWALVDAGFMRPKVARPDVVNGKCPGRPQNTPIQIRNVRMIKKGGLTYISGKIIVQENNFTQYRVHFQSKRCLSQEALDTCADVRDLVLDNICSTSFVYAQVFATFAKSIHPSMDCPVKQGTYIVNNATFDIGSLFAVPEIDKWYWKSQASLYDQNRDVFISCVVLEGQLVSL